MKIRFRRQILNLEGGAYTVEVDDGSCISKHSDWDLNLPLLRYQQRLYRHNALSVALRSTPTGNRQNTLCVGARKSLAFLPIRVD
jgi:hypothetical protein